MENTTDPTNINEPLAVDGVATVPGTRHAFLTPEAGAPNGVYIVSSGAWTRSNDGGRAEETAT